MAEIIHPENSHGATIGSFQTEGADQARPTEQTLGPSTSDHLFQVVVRGSDNTVRRQLNILADDNGLTLLLERKIPPES